MNAMDSDTVIRYEHFKDGADPTVRLKPNQVTLRFVLPLCVVTLRSSSAVHLHCCLQSSTGELLGFPEAHIGCKSVRMVVVRIRIMGSFADAFGNGTLGPRSASTRVEL